MSARVILIIEDEQAIARAEQLLLEGAGYAVRWVADGETALRFLAEAVPPPELILLDLMLPGMDGFQVCRDIRALPRYYPVIMLTARDQPVDKLRGLDVGADLYLTKPFAPAEMLAHIKAIFRLIDQHRNSPAGADALTGLPIACGALMIDDAGQRAQVDGRALDLAPKEYALLRLLMQHPGRAFGRESLLQLVWGSGYIGEARTVDVHIQRLRAKIEDDPANPKRLQTVRGFGYRLAAPEEQG